MVEHHVANVNVAGSRPVSRLEYFVGVGVGSNPVLRVKMFNPERSIYEDNGFLEQKSDCNGFEID